MQQIFFHVGLGKVASTYLQYAFFPKLTGVQYIQRTRYKKAPQIIKKSKASTILISREFDQQLEEECRWFSTYYPNTHIIMLLRRHDSWIASQYRRFVKNGESMTFLEFLNVHDDSGRWKINDLKYFDKIQILQKYFPEGKILIGFYEDLKQQPFHFFRKLADFIGADFKNEDISLNTIHSSYKEKQLKVMRAIGRKIFTQNPTFSTNPFWFWVQRRSRLWACYLILYPSLLLPSSWFSSEPLIDPEELKAVKDYFADDWTAVQQWAAHHNP